MRHKLLLAVLLGNALDYYNFLLFAYLGPTIVGALIPNVAAKEAHLLSLLLFAIPFIVRPFGGYIFGRISDLQGRQQALVKTIKWTGFTSLAIAVLPTGCGGFIGAAALLALRALQGLYLGGEYATAGVFLMEAHKFNRCLISSLLVASCTFGSLVALAFSWARSSEWWRVGFLLGGAATYCAYLIRKNATSSTKAQSADTDDSRQIPISRWKSITVTILMGSLISVTYWLPMVYTNFYLTQIMHLPEVYGQKATLIGLISCLVFNPAFGAIADKSSGFLVMTVGSLLSISFGIIGFCMVKNGFLIGQVLLAMGTAAFGAPVHAVMYSLFPRVSKATNIGMFFMIGSSLGAAMPFVSGYCAERHHAESLPIATLIVVGLATFLVLYSTFYTGRSKR